MTNDTEPCVPVSELPVECPRCEYNGPTEPGMRPSICPRCSLDHELMSELRELVETFKDPPEYVENEIAIDIAELCGDELEQLIEEHTDE